MVGHHDRIGLDDDAAGEVVELVAPVARLQPGRRCAGTGGDGAALLLRNQLTRRAAQRGNISASARGSAPAGWRCDGAGVVGRPARRRARGCRCAPACAGASLRPCASWPVRAGAFVRVVGGRQMVTPDRVEWRGQHNRSAVADVIAPHLEGREGNARTRCYAAGARNRARQACARAQSLGRCAIRAGVLSVLCAGAAAAQGMLGRAGTLALLSHSREQEATADPRRVVALYGRGGGMDGVLRGDRRQQGLRRAKSERG